MGCLTDLWKKAKELFPDVTMQTAKVSLERRATPQFIDEGFLEWLRRVLGVPHIEWRVFYSTYKGWHYVGFSEPFPERPAVVAVSSGFYYDLPSIPSLPDLRLPRVSLPEWTRLDYRDTYGRSVQDEFKKRMGDWSFLNWLRDRFSDIFYWVGYAVGSLQNWFWDISIKPHADRWNSAVKSFTDSTNSLLEGFEDSWNVEVVSRINTALKDTQERMLNLVRGLGITPMAVRNVDTGSCEVFAPNGVDVYIIAAGRP